LKLSEETNFSTTKASPGAFKLYLEFYKSLLFILWFTALSNQELSDNPIAALSSLIIAISPLIHVLLKIRSMLRYAS
jgi:hypothetical protein